MGSYWSGGTLYYYRCSAIDVAKSNSNVIWVGYQNGRVGKTTNGGTSWARVDDNGVDFPDRYVTDIAINPINPSQVFISFSGFNGDNVWYTSDGGTSWAEKTGTAPYDLPDLQVNTVRFHPQNSNWVYIGTDLGVFSSENKGTDWSLMMHFPDNDGPVNTEVSELFWQGDNYLIAATHGRGMYRAQVMVHIYVDGSASPGGDGTQANPFQTVREAFDIAGHGSTIHIEAGTYDEAPSSLYATQDLGLIIVTNGSVIIK